MKPQSHLRILRFPLLAIVSILTFVVACEEYQYKHGSIVGTICDATTGEGIGVCNVLVADANDSVVDRQTTDASGKYKTKDLEDGTYTVSFEKEGYYTRASKTVRVTSGETTTCDITLSRIPAKITADVEELDFGANESLTTRSFNIVNPYHDALDWIIEFKCEWIVSISPKNDNLAYGKTATIVVKINRDKLSGGDNKTVLVVKSLNGQGSVDVVVKAVGAVKEAPVLNVIGISDIDKTTAKLSGEIVKSGIPAYTRRGFTISLKTMDDNATEMAAEVNANATFSYAVSGLTAGAKYYVRAYAVSDYAGKVWSANELSFTTIESYPQVRTDDVSELNLTNGTCILNGYIEHSGNPAYTERGFCVCDNGEPTIDNSSYKVSGNGIGAFSSTISGLINENTYRVRAFTIQNGRVFYGSTVSFSTATTPTSVATTGPSAVTHNSAILNGTILKEGNPKYTERGFCYSVTNKTPTISDTKVAVSNSSSADFSYHLSNLDHNKTFWFRAYAIQNGQPTYGDVASFETKWSETKVFTRAADNIKYYEMTLRGQINDIGVPAYSQRGFCYSLWQEEPTLLNSTKLTVAGVSEGAFSYHLADLTARSTYYYRAFAIQDGTTIYGDVMTASTYSPPQIITSDATATPDEGMLNLSWTVELTGIYGYKGDPECSDFGFVYGPGDNPTAENTYGYTVVQATTVVPFANSQGSFSVVLKEMVGYTKYYYRAYAKTSLGYTYGEVKAFSTQPNNVY
ncbi:MAG: carboxypeptidase regulatory-like domain-containing protein [Bacteroidales bacterium]|nr:carboxypeptidase regulatory-like domain-containing protein [Bacteroidales bacterium]